MGDPNENREKRLPSPARLSGLWGRLVRFGFRLLYNEFAWSYDIVSWAVSLGSWRRWQLGSLNFVQGKDILEIAHGPGHMLSELAARGFQVTGCDLSPAMGRQAKRHLQRAGLNNRIGLVRCYIPDFPFQSSRFDTVLSQFPTNFIFETETLAEIYRMLRPAGRLVILPEGHLTTRGPLSRFIHQLFVITGQAAPAGKTELTEETERLEHLWHPFVERMEMVGFHVKIEEIKLANSAATVLIAIK